MKDSYLINIDITSFGYIDKQTVLKSINLEIKEKKIIGIMGTNGSGKSTLLNLIYGSITGKFIEINKRIKSNQIEMVHQDYRESLFPWKSALNNICLPTHFNNNKKKCSQAVKSLIDTFNIGFNLNKLPDKLSGGEQQKVVVLRSLMSSPKLLLLDEPFSAMDYASRYLFLRQLRKKINSDGITAILVSHTAEDIFIFCDELVLLSSEGSIDKRIENCQSKDDYLKKLETINGFFNNHK